MKLEVLPNSPWYAEGLSFGCTQCGNCCTGGPGYVWISEEEIARLGEYLKMSAAEVVEKYCRNIGGRVSLQERRNGQGLYDCVFLVEEEGRGSSQGSGPASVVRQARRVCSVYPVRPGQCRSWPFWKENLASESAWGHASKRCPGIGNGRHYGFEEIEGISEDD